MSCQSFIQIQQLSYLTPNQQSIFRDLSMLDPGLTIYENYKSINPEVNERMARTNLARFLFRNSNANKLASNLSGGEKLRAMFACILTSLNPPQLMILDEPTNHLDLDSIKSLESALQCYQGALIVISHDQQFIENVGIQRFLHL